MQIKIRDEYFQLTVEEFYLYCWLRSNMNYRAEYYTTTGLIVASVEILKKKQANKQKIIELLVALKTKEVININADIASIGQHNPIKIEFACSGDIRNKYTMIDCDMLATNIPQYFFVLATLLKWQGVRDKQFSLEEWSKILNISVKTVQRIMNEMEELEYIHIKRGTYYEVENGLRQEMNQYYIGDMWNSNKTICHDDDTSDNAHNNTIDENKQDNGLIAGKYTDKRLLEHDNLITYKKLKPFDFEIYLTTDDDVLKAHCDEVVFPNISQKESGKKYVDNMLAKTRLKLQQIEAHRKQQEALIGNTPPPERLEWEYKKRDKEEIG